MSGLSERGLWLDDTAHRDDLSTIVDRSLLLDYAAVIRFRQRPGTGQVVAWVSTGFDVLASRVVAGRVRPTDLSSGGYTLARSLPVLDGAGFVELGFPMDSAWRGVLPPDTGFAHLDDVPAWAILELVERGTALAKEHSSAHGPPASLLDQELLAVSAGETSVGIPMRCVFALTAMGFLPQSADVLSSEEIVRVRVHPAWLRIDARFGTVYRRLGDPAMVLR
jgi:hypothetical protein